MSNVMDLPPADKNSNTGDPRCPHCGYEDHEWHEVTNLSGDADTENVDCPECDKPYKIQMIVSTTFDTWGMTALDVKVEILEDRLAASGRSERWFRRAASRCTGDSGAEYRHALLIHNKRTYQFENELKELKASA